MSQGFHTDVKAAVLRCEAAQESIQLFERCLITGQREFPVRINLFLQRMDRLEQE